MNTLPPGLIWLSQEKVKKYQNQVFKFKKDDGVHFIPHKEIYWLMNTLPPGLFDFLKKKNKKYQNQVFKFKQNDGVHFIPYKENY